MPSANLIRRRCLQAGVSACLLPLAGRGVAATATATATATGDGVDVAQALRRGGVVIAFRHALAPGTFDPPGFRLDDCSTQRNLSDEGRDQARRLGAWFRERGLVPAAVRSSPWCRCMETARLAFGEAQAWDPLSSPRREGGEDAQRMAALRQALAAVPAGRFEAWVSHQFTLSALVGQSTSSGEGLLLQAGDNGAPRLLARLDPP